ncbi:MAG: hypothetical protein F6K40_30000 [Okeania sp. SIO3I5]|nr:hypothetical protein [Okeania sp. SIO3I5]NEQ40251.1 hypothetical protein [Okeania sp. SIO3I5]
MQRFPTEYVGAAVQHGKAKFSGGKTAIEGNNLVWLDDDQFYFLSHAAQT